MTMSTGFIRSPHACKNVNDSPTQVSETINTSTAYPSERSDHHVKSKITKPAGAA